MAKLSKYICCSVHLTLATRAIAFLGLGITTFLVTVLLNDHDDYYYTRKTVLGLGLDWSHFHKRGNTSISADPEGTMISVVAISYAIIFLTTNVLLLLGAILNKRYLALPWLVCELVGCLSKVGALITHIIAESDNVNVLFITGSTIYVVVIIWLWTVVFLAQLGWNKPPTDYRGKTFEDVFPLRDLSQNSYVHNTLFTDFHREV